MIDSDPPKVWYFTFGFGHAHPNGYVKIHGTFNSARDEMNRRYDNVWCMQYTHEAIEKSIEEWGMHEVK